VNKGRDYAKKSYIKPCLTIPFKSDVSTKTVNTIKKQLCCAEEFNLVYKTSSSLIALVRRVQGWREGNNNVHGTVNSQGSEEGGEGSNSGIVYSAVCKKCEDNGCKMEYVGETGRQLKVRLKEHFARIDPGKDPTTISSAIACHSIVSHGEQPNQSSWTISVLRRCNQTQNRRALEALEILKRKPVLNKDKGVRIILCGSVL
jgi:hypothetical protein